MSRNTETKIILYTYNKGGVGKTTLALHITGVLRKQTSGKIIMVDCDPRPNSWSFYKRRKCLRKIS
mgnify:CR=1 FL=1